MKAQREALSNTPTAKRSVKPAHEPGRCRAAGPPVRRFHTKQASNTRCNRKVLASSVAPFCAKCLCMARQPGAVSFLGHQIVTDKGHEELHQKNVDALLHARQLPHIWQVLTREESDPQFSFFWQGNPHLSDDLKRKIQEWKARGSVLFSLLLEKVERNPHRAFEILDVWVDWDFLIR